MAKPFNEVLQPCYTEAAKLVRAMDATEGGVESPRDTLVTALFALEAGLITANLTNGQNSAFDALVMLHELRERVTV